MGAVCGNNDPVDMSNSRKKKKAIDQMTMPDAEAWKKVNALW